MLANRFFKRDNDSEHIVFRDVLLFTIAILALLMVIIMAAYNPNKTQKNAAQDNIIGSFRAEIFWPNGKDVDVDLWVMAPGGPPVGYSNPSGPVLNLVRDDLGMAGDMTPINYEICFSRGLPTGEWVVNVHWYGNNEQLPEVPVDVYVTIKRNAGASPTVFHTQLIMKFLGQELTAFRFKLDDDGNVVQDSMNHIYMPLRDRRVEAHIIPQSPASGPSGATTTP